MKHLKRYNELTTESGDFNWEDVIKKQRGPNDKWDKLEKDMVFLVDKYSDDFGPDSYGVVDAMYQIMEGMFQKK